ncbi:MAG: hypothetical protein IJV24_01730 [Prevotella sp.]|nr:hypothetical protein [Prevotella sp.]
MTNRRSLKKAIHAVCNELLTECVAASLYGNDAQAENAEALLSTIIKIQTNSLARVSHPEPGMSPRKYFNDLRSKFAAEASEIADHINNL